MKFVKFLTACAVLCATTVVAAQIQEAGCPCRNRKPPVPKPEQENEVQFMNACGGCRGRDRGKDLTIVQAGCPCQNKQRVQPRPLPEKKESALYSQMADMALKNQKFVGGKKAPASRDQLNIRDKGYFFFNSPAPYETVTHYLKEADARGSLVTIQDGSVWAVKESDQYLVKRWPVNAALTVKPNSLTLWNKLTGTRPDHKFRIVNLKTNESVAASLSLGPFKFSPNTRKIEDLDYARGEIYLNNGTIWKVDLTGPCQQIFRDWKKGQAIICGSNDTWFSLGSPFILVSVEKENWLPATRIR
ncbi:MAG: hypothetical protein JSS12_05280 [Verrucomicrobia bacterium]|nr:hypothetical protein [Verrucomicrobiota bacterium]